LAGLIELTIHMYVDIFTLSISTSAP